ncbi:glycosyltransferase [Kitasatospora sp. NPDC094016]|uniref:glycosyltransferase n=1 Tax=Kitasatospora sp. NPDC094016 TaxID=3154986 RepID=UPI003323C19E
MSPQRANQPRIAVVIPTYNRSALLRSTLAALARQRLPVSEFEVVVSDDGSSDDTSDTVAGFVDRLRLQYHFQEDLGFRASAARNAGARRTSAPILVFLDAGVLPGPDFLSAHLSAHLSAQLPGSAVAGYIFGYQPDGPVAALDETTWTLDPEQLIRNYGDSPEFRDARHLAFERFGFDLGNCAVPWQWFWSGNCSVRAADFWAAGGFDEDFRSWGGEDTELAYRLFGRGARFVVSRAAWAIEAPHPRTVVPNLSSGSANMLMVLHKHPDTVVELLWSWFAREQHSQFQIHHDWNVEDEYLLVLDAVAKARSVDVTDELAQLRHMAGNARIAVLGCGDDVPDWLATAELFDFDREVVEKAAYQVSHAIGLRTALPDNSVDLVFVTSRLRTLWDQWESTIRAEARRIGGDLLGPPEPR